MSDKPKMAAAERRQGPVALAILPNGEALRPQAVERISIEPWPTLFGQEGRRFAVVLHLVGGARRTVAGDLGPDEANDLGRRCGQIVNDALRQG